MTKRTKQTAQEAYEGHQLQITSLMLRIQAQLAEHAAKQAAQPKNWGYAGDLEEVESRLQSVADFLTPEGK
jgi:non-ribosomal peptide synthetase component F